MKSSPFLISLMLMGAGLANASLLRTYGDESSFLAALYPNPYQETFADTGRSGTSLSYSGNGLGYTASVGSMNTLQTSHGWLQPFLVSDITIVFTSGNVTAIGGDFFAVNSLAQVKGTTDTLTFSDGTTQTIATGTSSTSFTG